MKCTAITYIDWKKEVRYSVDHVPNAKEIWVSTISYPDIPEDLVKQIQNTSHDKVQEILNKLF